MGLGVYWIRCLVTGKVYIGSSVNVRSRLDSHRTLLDGGKHHSTKLQRAWDKYGADSFDMDLVDPVYNLDRLRDAETIWISYYNSYQDGYNMTPNGHTGTGTTIPQETRVRMSEGAKRAGQDEQLRKSRSERAKLQHAAGNLGQSCWKPGTAKAVGAKLKGRKRPDMSASLVGNQRAKKRKTT